MEYIKEYPQFPCLWLGLEDWNSDSINELIWFDDLIYKESENLENQCFIDSTGKIFRVIGIEYFSKWRKFIPNASIGRVKFLFKNKTMSLSELKNYVLSCISKLDNKEAALKWRNQVIKAKSYKEIYLGNRS